MALQIANLFSVAGKHAVVTGGGRGIGLMFAEALVANGATVYITSRSADACNEAAAKLSDTHASTGGTCVSLPHDLSNESGCLDFVSDLKERTDKLNVLINNSGVTWGEPLDSYPDKAWDKLWNVNVKALFTVTRACLPLLDKASTAEDPGRVINVGSIAGIMPQPIPTFAYDASKAAVHHLTKKLATEFADRKKQGGHSITVNAIAPGFVPSKMSNQLLTYATAEQIASCVPLGRLGTPEDMGGAALYLASRAGAWTTGHVLTVDGGTVSVPFAMMPGL